jgi:hypothetical protein
LAAALTDKIVNVCCADRPATAKANRAEAKQENRVVDELAAIPAPTGLEGVYIAYVASYRADAQIDSDFAAARLASGQSFAWSTFESRWTAREAPMTRSRIALIQYAAQNHLSLPRWVHNVGGK